MQILTIHFASQKRDPWKLCWMDLWTTPLSLLSFKLKLPKKESRHSRASFSPLFHISSSLKLGTNQDPGQILGNGFERQGLLILDNPQTLDNPVFCCSLASQGSTCLESTQIGLCQGPRRTSDLQAASFNHSGFSSRVSPPPNLTRRPFLN